MKKTLIIALALLTFASTALLAQFTPYGSARIGFWYENADEELSGVKDGTLNLHNYLQTNSHIGARFIDEDKRAQVEFGAEGNIRLLWAGYKLNSFNMLVGQDATLINQKGTMAWNNDNNFNSWGGTFEGFKPQIRFTFDNGLSFALVEPNVVDVRGISGGKSILIPKINLGYKMDIGDNINLATAGGFNMYNYDENQGGHDETVMSFIVALLFDMDFGDIGIKIHGNFGQNTGNYGLPSQTDNYARWNSEKKEIAAVTTMGGFGEFSYSLSDDALLTLGGSYTMSNNDLYKEADAAMAAFGQFRYQIAKGFYVVPEVGMLDKMKDKDDKEEGSLIYFGTQLRLDF